MKEEIPLLFQDLFREHYPVVLRKICHLVGSRIVAEDLAQEVFLRLYQNPPNDLCRIGPWLHRVATRITYDYLRGIRRQRDLQQQIQNQMAPIDALVPSNEQAALREMENEDVKKVLCKLSERDRRALLLRHSGYSYAEIAELLEVRQEIVGSILLRAASRFKKIYQNEGVSVNEGESSLHPIHLASLC